MTRQHDDALFLSLRPSFAELILDGVKRVELRRIRPRAQRGTSVIVYATSPVKAVLGGCTVRSVLTADPDEVWELHGALASVERDGFDEYFAGAEQATAIQLSSPWRLARPVSLAALRTSWEGFSPPQSFRYVRRRDFRWIENRVKAPSLSRSRRSPAA